MNMVGVNFHFSFGILAVVHKLYLSHIAKKCLQFRYKLGCTAIGRVHTRNFNPHHIDPHQFDPHQICVHTTQKVDPHQHNPHHIDPHQLCVHTKQFDIPQ